MELKISKKRNMESVAKKAIEQIEEKVYYQELINDNVNTIYKQVVVFKNKKCIVR